jgi:hypothetical protein
VTSSDPSRLSLDTVVCASSNQVSSRVGDEVVILDLDSSLQQPARLDAVLEAMVSEFDVDRQTARTDLLTLVDALVAQKLVEARASGAA